jgi:Na+/melibiose symporter-like transporter
VKRAKQEISSTEKPKACFLRIIVFLFSIVFDVVEIPCGTSFAGMTRYNSLRE